MARLIFIAFPLLMIALTGIAIYVQITSSTLSLPIATGTTVLTILLPLLTTANIIYTPLLYRLTRSSNLRQLLVPALHILQGVITVIIATLAAEGFAPGQVLDCGLQGRWQALWHTHDNSGNRAIERIQNTFDCCGFRTIKDRVWPADCAKIYGRDTPCHGPWQAAMQRTSGLQFAVAVVACLMQLAHLVYLRQRGGMGNTTQAFKRFPQPADGENNGRLIEEPYHDEEEEEEEETSADQTPSRPAFPAGQDDARPRVEPSGLGHDEANEWRS